MPIISTKLHGAGDYATGSLTLAAPLLPFADRPATTLLQAGGAVTLTGSALTDYELGISRQIPMPVHLIGDAVGGVAMVAAAWGLRRRGSGLGSWLPVALVGLGQIAGAALTERVPGDRGPTAPSGPSGVPVGAPAPAAPTPTASPPTVSTPAAPDPTTSTPTAATLTASAPTAAATADPPADDALVAQQASAAAAEAGSIGGAVTPAADDPTMAPVYEAGGGEEEGFEAAEAELIENASHFDNARSPRRDAMTPEAESDRATAVYGEGDEERSSETADEAGPGSTPD